MNFRKLEGGVVGVVFRPDFEGVLPVRYAF